MGRISDFFRRSRRVTDDAPTQQLRRPVPQAPILVGNVQGIGAREGQEDSFALVNASDPEAMARRGVFAVVADGMGGLADGKAISEAAVDSFLAALPDTGRDWRCSPSAADRHLRHQ